MRRAVSKRPMLAVVLVASISLWGVACFRSEADPPAPPPPLKPLGTKELLAAPPAKLPSIVRCRYCLIPDRRLLAAVTEVQRLRTGKAPEPARAEFLDGKWTIFSGQGEVGMLSEYPTFEEATNLLTAWAAKSPLAMGQGSPVSAAGLDRAVSALDMAALLKALSSLDGSPADWQRDAASRHSITSALAWLSTLTWDGLGQSDPLLAEAWAWLAIERANGGGNPTDETLVARALGYEAAAARSSSTLAGDDPIRLYAAGDEPGLSALCAGRPADRACHFFRLALLAERRQAEGSRAALLASPFKTEKSLVVRALEARLSDFEKGPNPGRDLAALAFQAVSAKNAESAVEDRSRDFETAVDQLASSEGRRPIDPAALQAAYRAAFYSGLFQEVSFFLNQRSSAIQAREIAVSFAPASPTAEELSRWIELKAQVLDGSRDLRPLAVFLESSRSIGAVPLFELGESIAQLSASTEPLRRRPMPALFERLDSRPSHLVMAARLARRNLTFPGLFEKLARAAAETAPHLSGELPALAAEMREDAARLREIADDPAMAGYAQSVALAGLASLGKADDAFVRARYESIADRPDQGADVLVDFLERRDDLAGALAAVEAELKREGDSGSLDWAYLVTEKARLQLKMGDPERAFKTLQPALEVYKEDTLLQGAKIELARNHPAAALKLAQDALARYPERSSETSGLIASARWRLGDYAATAKELAASRNGIVGDWNRYLPEAFAETFAKAPEASVKGAFAELVAAGIAPHVLADVAVALGKARGTEIALPLLAGLRDPKPEWNDHMRLSTYELIREKSNAEAALDWIRKAISDRSHNFAMTLYQNRKYDLLLGLYANGGESTNPRLVGMLKAASLLHLRETSGPRWDNVVTEVEKDASNDFFVVATRYLVGRAEAGTVLQPAPDAGHLASIGWVMGVKAASERRFADADGWFQVALESGQQQQPPHAWSWVIESDWLQAERSLGALEKKGEF